MSTTLSTPQLQYCPVTRQQCVLQPVLEAIAHKGELDVEKVSELRTRSGVTFRSYSKEGPE